jgi:2-polyprenyl-6-methoxyphenol hydroxylase-like FAD-dependent oxidoreductase
MSHDVVIVGARCAGAPLAMLLARQGRRVLVLDRTRFPSDTVSTHFMWPRTTAFLDRWGLREKLAATGCPPIDVVRMHWGPVTVQGRPAAVDGNDTMYCPRRTVLDALLVQAARDAGAEVREGCTVRNLMTEDGRVAGIVADDAEGKSFTAMARVTVGADGLFSHVAAAVEAPIERTHPPLTCGFYAYWSGVPTEGVEFYLREGRDVLVFPTHDGRTCIWVGRSACEWNLYRSDVEGNYLAGLDSSLRERVGAGRRETPFKGTNKLPNQYRRSHGPGWALVGDAAYHRDPLTGMGIGDAFLGAELLAEALHTGLEGNSDDVLDAALAGYEKAFRERTGPVFDYTLQSAALKNPAALVPFYEAIARNSGLTQSLMDVLGGTLPARALFNASTITRYIGGA